MLREFYEEFVHAYNGYFDGSSFWPLCIICAAVCYILVEKNNSRKSTLVWLPVTIILVTLCNPIYYKLADKAADYAYARTYWYIPFFFLLAFHIVIIIFSIPARRRLVVSAVVVIAMAVWGTGIFSDKCAFSFNMTHNTCKLSQDVIDICDAVAADRESNMVLSPRDINMYTRVYNADIINVISSWNRETYPEDEFMQKESPRINMEINSKTPNVKYLMTVMEHTGCRYIVFARSQNPGDDMNLYGTCILSTEDYLLYKIDR